MLIHVLRGNVEIAATYISGPGSKEIGPAEKEFISAVLVFMAMALSEARINPEIYAHMGKAIEEIKRALAVQPVAGETAPIEKMPLSPN